MGDGSQEAEVARMVKEIAGTLGAVDILINNAAVRRDDAFTAMSFKDWRLVMAVVLDGAFLMSPAVLPGLVAQNSGPPPQHRGPPPPTGAPRRAQVPAPQHGPRAP